MTFIPVIREGMSHNNCKNLILEPMQWGLTEFGNGLIINARYDEAKEKPLFKHKVETNRCIVVIDGYYEWK
jgi:putative SOS response-associated peptidase YedK